MAKIVPDASTTMAMHRATGLPVMEAKAFIIEESPELVRRILEGHRVQLMTQTWVRLHDPIEDDPVAGGTVRQVLEQTGSEIEAEHAHERPRGLCYLIWHTAQKRLLLDHAIVWYTPAQMNPCSCFD